MSVNNYGSPYTNYPQSYAYAPPYPGQYTPQPAKKKHPVRNGMLTGGVIGATLGALSHTDKAINSSIESVLSKFAENLPKNNKFDFPITAGFIKLEESTVQNIKDVASELNTGGFPQLIKNDSIKIITEENALKLREKLVAKDFTALKAAGVIGLAGALSGIVAGWLFSLLKKDRN